MQGVSGLCALANAKYVLRVAGDMEEIFFRETVSGFKSATHFRSPSNAINAVSRARGNPVTVILLTFARIAGAVATQLAVTWLREQHTAHVFLSRTPLIPSRAISKDD